MMCAPNDANKNKNKIYIDQITTQKVVEAVHENKNKILKVNDDVRCVLHKNLFDKGSNANGQQKCIS